MKLEAADPGLRRIERYGAGGFTIAGRTYQGSVVVLPDRVLSWPPADPAALAPADFADLIEARGEFEVLLVGTGQNLRPMPGAIRQALSEAGIAHDPMGTGAACRTYNVLVAEGRRIAAALLAVD